MASTNERPRKTYAERNADSHRRLMDATIELIVAKGFDRTTAQEIGERAGYSRNMVRDRYGSKESLLEALCEREFADRLLAESTLSDDATGLDLVLDRLDGIRDAVGSEPHQFLAVVVLAFEAAGPIPSIRTWWAAMIARFEDALRRDLETGKRDGSIRSDLDVEREAEIFVSYGAGLCYRWSLRQPGYDLVAELTDWRERLRAQYAAGEAPTPPTLAH